MKINKLKYIIVIIFLAIIMTECNPAHTGYRRSHRKKCDCPTFSIRQTNDSRTRAI